MDTRGALLALALVAVLVAAPALAASQIAVTLSSETYTAQFTIPVYNASINLAANTSQTINVTLPNNWSKNDIDYILVHVETDAPIHLSAVTNGTVVASADVVPLSSGYTVTFPYSDQIRLAAAQQAAQAVVAVYLVSNDVEFTLNLESNTVKLYPNQSAFVKMNITQKNGPKVFVYFNTVYNFNISGFNAQVFKNDKATPYEGSAYGKWTTGAGWTDTAYLRLYWDGSGQETNLIIQVILYADPDGPDGPVRPMSVASISLDAPLPAAIANAAKKIDAKKIGIGIIALFALFLLLGGGKRGRRGTGTPNAMILLILVAALAIGLGLIDVDVHPSIDAKMLGIGIIALLLFLMMAKPGAFQKAARRLGF